MRNKVQSFLQIISYFDTWVEQHYPRGKLVRWTWGKYNGRLAEIDKAVWNTDDGIFKVLVTVKTMRADGRGFINNSDLLHRIYREVDEYFISTS